MSYGHRYRRAPCLPALSPKVFVAHISVNMGRVDETFSGLETLLDSIPIRLLNLRTSVIGMRPDLSLKDFIPQS